MIGRLAAAVTGPRGRRGTVGGRVALGVAVLVARGHIGGVTAAGQSSFVPSDAESTRVVDVLQRDFRGGDDVPVLIVFERNGGLPAAALNAIGGVGKGLERLGLTGATPVFAPYSGEAKRPLGEVARIARGIGPVSRDGEAALVGVGIDAGNRGAVVDGVTEIRAYLAKPPRPGLHSYVPGPGGIAAALVRVAG